MYSPTLSVGADVHLDKIVLRAVDKLGGHEVIERFRVTNNLPGAQSAAATVAEVATRLGYTRVEIGWEATGMLWIPFHRFLSTSPSLQPFQLDRATSLLAQKLKVDLFLISTSVSQVAINFNQPDQQWLDKMTAAEARAYQTEGHFKPGSMGPKIEAVLSFLDAHPAGKALITDPPNIAHALDGKGGTWIVCQ